VAEIPPIKLKFTLIPQHIPGKSEQILLECLENDEPFFILRAKDFFTLHTLVYYIEQVEKFGPTNPEFEEDVVERINDVKAWQAANPHLVRFPD
jgi:hypothetical protein